jgi:hypothetical protein
MVDIGPETGIAAAGAAAMPTIQGDTTWGGHYSFPAIGFSRYDPVTKITTAYTNNPKLQHAGVDFAAADWAIGFGCVENPVGSNTFDTDSGVALASPILGYDMINWAENGSILPVDRVYFDYRHFDRVGSLTAWNPGVPPSYQIPLSVDRYCVGVEKTFWDGMMSLETRLPFHGQADARLDTTYGAALGESLQIGNVGLSWKTYLLRRPFWSLTGGLGLQLPTASDAQFSWNVNVGPTYAPGTPRPEGWHQHEAKLVQANETVWLTPFFGLVVNPDGRAFLQALMQLDLPLNTSHAMLNYNIYEIEKDKVWANQLWHYESPIGISFDPVMRVNTQLGYWLYQDGCAALSSLAAILEVNLASTLTDEPEFQKNVVNLGPALAAKIRQTEVAVGTLLPISDDMAYEWELALRVNRRF